MRRATLVGTATFAFVLNGFGAQAGPVFHGIWATPSCDGAEVVTYLGPAASIYAEENDFFFERATYDGVVHGDWTLVLFGTEDDPYPVFMKRDGDLLTEAYPDDWPTDPFAAAAALTQMREGEVTPDTSTLFDMDVSEACPRLPSPWSYVLGEAVAFLKDAEPALDDCGDVETCARALFAAADVAKDWALSPAEMARAIRVALVLSIGASDEDVSLEDAAGGSLAALPLAPIAAATVLHSFDYDRSGSVSFEELMGERLPFIPDAPDLEDPFTILSDMADGVRDLTEEAQSAVPF